MTVADAFLGEIRMAGFGFAPKGWAACDGQLLPLNQNTALFSLLGGGDPRVQYRPDHRLRRHPCHTADVRAGSSNSPRPYPLPYVMC